MSKKHITEKEFSEEEARFIKYADSLPAEERETMYRFKEIAESLPLEDLRELIEKLERDICESENAE